MGWSARRLTTSGAPVVASLACFVLILGAGIAIGELLRLGEAPNASTALDRTVASWAVAHRTPALTGIARTLSVIGSQVVLLPLTGIVTVALLVRRRRSQWRRPAALLVAAWGGAIVLYQVTKQVVDRARPPVAGRLVDPGPSSSFPSGHATQSMGTLLALAAVGTIVVGRRRGPGRTAAVAVMLALAVALALAVGWSRVYLEVHWTTDVVAGWLLGAAWTVALIRLSRRERPPDHAPASPGDPSYDGASDDGPAVGGPGVQCFLGT